MLSLAATTLKKLSILVINPATLGACATSMNIYEIGVKFGIDT